MLKHKKTGPGCNRAPGAAQIAVNAATFDRKEAQMNGQVNPKPDSASLSCRSNPAARTQKSQVLHIRKGEEETALFFLGSPLAIYILPEKRTK
jgi:hypothetical protein